jgi:deoxyadenosine/deoxycytidine kinase|tara:strand:- start:486 stop:674 length:189 start_codon:yes stop_codon:yes gene_type:complete
MNSPIYFLYRRLEECKTMSEKENILDLILAENQKVKERKNIEELKVAYSVMKLIYEKYYEQA